MPCATSLGSAVVSTSLNSSLAVCPISSFSACGSCRPGTWTTMRLLALADDRRLARAERVDAALRTTSFAVSIAWSIACSIPAAVGVRTKRLPSTTSIVPVALAGQPGAAGQRQDRLARRVDLRRVLEQEAERAAAVGDVADADPRLGAAQRAADDLFHVLEPLPAQPGSDRPRAGCGCHPRGRGPRLICGSGRASGQASASGAHQRRQQRSSTSASVSAQSQITFQRGKSSMCQRSSEHRSGGSSVVRRGGAGRRDDVADRGLDRLDLAHWRRARDRRSDRRP